MKKALTIGIDFHKKNTQICVMNSQLEIVEEKRISSEDKSLRKFFVNYPKSLIGIEISGGVFHVAHLLKECGHEVKILKPDAAKPFRRAGQKSDRIDARALATALLSGTCEEIYFKEEGVRLLKALLSSREMLIKQRVMLVCHLRGLLREFGITMPKGISRFFAQAGEKLMEIESDVLRNQLCQTYQQIESLKCEEKKLDRQLEEVYGGDDRVKRLRTIPGVGPVTALCLLTTIGSAERFYDGHQVSSYLGLAPRQKSSGEKKRFGAITKAGCGLTRRNLIHGARAVLFLSKKEDPMINWAKNIRNSQAPTNVKVVALASKMARVALALLKNNSAYDPHFGKTSTKAA